MKAMILAAGRGKRMRPLTDTTPKALLQIGGQALIDYHIKALIAAGIAEIVVNLAWLGDQIADYLGNGERFGAAIQYSNEGASALETGGGIYRALPLLGDEPFWVVNGDVYSNYPFDAPGLAEHSLAHLVLVANPDHNPAGDFALEQGCVRNQGNPKYTYSGIGLFRPELFAGQSDGVFPLAPLLRSAADQRQLAGELFTGLWSDVGTPERLAEIQSLYST